jgi:tRNA G18 (ribose-2'-O)-methylase SpoU
MTTQSINPTHTQALEVYKFKWLNIDVFRWVTVAQNAYRFCACPAAMQVAPDTYYLIINHISKSNNIKTLITSAKAFGAKVLIVGAPKACTAHSHALSLLAEGDGKRFDTLQACRDWLTSMNVAIVGVEIVAAADNIESEPFDGSVAFLMGNEGSGMSEQQKAICNR